MTYSLHPQAEKDIESAFRYYRENAGDKVTLRFLDEF